MGVRALSYFARTSRISAMASRLSAASCVAIVAGLRRPIGIGAPGRAFQNEAHAMLRPPSADSGRNSREWPARPFSVSSSTKASPIGRSQPSWKISVVSKPPSVRNRPAVELRQVTLLGRLRHDRVSVFASGRSERVRMRAETRKPRGRSRELVVQRGRRAEHVENQMKIGPSRQPICRGGSAKCLSTGLVVQCRRRLESAMDATAPRRGGDTRERILDTAEAAVLEKGFAGDVDRGIDRRRRHHQERLLLSFPRQGRIGEGAARPLHRARERPVRRPVQARR